MLKRKTTGVKENLFYYFSALGGMNVEIKKAEPKLVFAFRETSSHGQEKEKGRQEEASLASSSAFCGNKNHPQNLGWFLLYSNACHMFKIIVYCMSYVAG